MVLWRLLLNIFRSNKIDRGVSSLYFITLSGRQTRLVKTSFKDYARLLLILKAI